MPPNGYGYGRRGRGRCRRQHWIEHTETNMHYFKPLPGQPPSPNDVVITKDELEILRLVNIENLTQEEAARTMNMSRKTLWSDLQQVRKKITIALINGYGIRIQREPYIKQTIGDE